MAPPPMGPLRLFLLMCSVLPGEVFPAPHPSPAAAPSPQMFKLRGPKAETGDPFPIIPMVSRGRILRPDPVAMILLRKRRVVPHRINRGPKADEPEISPLSQDEAEVTQGDRRANILRGQRVLASPDDSSIPIQQNFESSDLEKRKDSQEDKESSKASRPEDSKKSDKGLDDGQSDIESPNKVPQGSGKADKGKEDTDAQKEDARTATGTGEAISEDDTIDNTKESLSTNGEIGRDDGNGGSGDGLDATADDGDADQNGSNDSSHDIDKDGSDDGTDDANKDGS
ncbi:unnamed protein product, partial [Darwinula stevensoni]